MRRLTLACCLLACAAPAAPVPKPEESSFRSSAWGKPIDPDKDCKFTFGKDSLTIEVPGKGHDLDARNKLSNAPRLLRDVEGDFVVEVRVTGDFHASEKPSVPKAEPMVSAGLIFASDDKNRHCYRVEFGALRTTDGSSSYSVYKSGVLGWVSHTVAFGAGSEKWPFDGKARQAYLRMELRRVEEEGPQLGKGTQLRCLISPDGKKWARWTALDNTTTFGIPRKLKVGVIVTTTSTKPVKVTFDRFKLTRLKPKAK